MSAYVDDYGTSVSVGGYHPHQHVQQQQAASTPVSITQRLRGNAGLSIDVGDTNQARSDQHHQQYQDHQDEYGYDGRYGYAEQEAHDILEGEDSPHESDEEVAEQLRMRGGGGGSGQQHYAYEDDLHGEQGLDHAEGEEEDLEDDAGSFSDSLSSSPSIPDEDIDFNLVYALHTFLATVDGQASVVKGDKLLLLDDSNSYWWLVRVLKTQAIGYIPAENIETPWERLARLNKHRNVDLTSATPQDAITGPTSTTAQTRFMGRIPPSQQPHPHESRHPYSKGIPASPSHKDHPRNISPEPERRPGSSKAKTVLFTAPTYYAHSATGMTTDDEEGYEGEEGEYDEEGLMQVDEHEQERGGGFEDDEEEEEIDEGHQAGGEESEFSDEEGGESNHHHQQRVAAGSRTPEAQRGYPTHLHEEHSGEVVGGFEDEDEEAAKREHWERERAAAIRAQEQAAEAEAQWVRGKEQEQQGSRRALTPQNINAQQLHPSSPAADLAASHSPKRSLSPRVASLGGGDGISATYSPTQRSPGRSPTAPSSFDENDFASGPTKKLTATPPIARTAASMDDEDHGAVFDPLADADMEAAPYELRYQSPSQQQGPLPPPATSAVPLSPLSSQHQQAPQKVRGVDLVDPKDPRYHRMLQPTKQAGEDVLYERMVQQQHQQQQQQQQQAQALQGKRSLEGSQLGHGHDGDTSMGSVDTTGASSVLSEGSASSASNKRASGSQGKDAGSGTEKKRKSGGGILGLFRKKDKKKNRSSTAGAADAQREDEPRSSEDSARASPTTSGGGSRRSGSASPASPRPSAEKSPSTGPASSSAASKRDSTINANSAESMFSTDAALRQQELEAKQALYQQYGVQRQPGDLSNTMTPRNVSGGGLGGGAGAIGLGVEPQPRSSTGSNRNSLQLLNHPASVVGANGLGSPSVGGALAPPQRIRPGSLMGSPSIAGIEVPLLSVMRVFAGSYIDSEATFKTVLLNQSTTSADLVKQAMQRFRLVGADLTRDDFYLTVKEIDGEERALGDEEKPLGVFEDLSERAGEDATLPPSVKRSSIGSITSISSNLSLNPAISRLGMNDWSDDSVVKFYLNRRGGPDPLPLHDGPGSSTMEDNAPTPTIPQYGDHDSGSDQTSTPTLGSSPHFADTASPPIASSFASTPPIPSSTNTNYRFAVRLVIHPSDLPESVVFDPQSNAIIPKAVLLERQQRMGGFADSGSVSPNAREKIIFFPRNANVSEVVEAALDRFGIVDGVVDGGDEVEDRISRRRSAIRVKYSLAAEHDGKEHLLNASSKLLEAYSAPPLFKAYDRSSKEFRRRSVDNTLVLGSPSDVQPSDPVFILRRSAVRAGASVGARGPLPHMIDELEERRQQRREEELEVLAGDSPVLPTAAGPSQRDLIAAQRAAQRANQRAILSAQKNSDQGIDINIPEQGTIRSRHADDEVRYSFINQDGTEVDISEIVENEWSTRTSEPPSSASSDVEQLGERADTATPTGGRPTSRLSRATTAASTADSFQTAREAPLSTDDEDDDQHAINALRSSSVAVDRVGSSASQRARSPGSSTSLTPQQPPYPISSGSGGEDVLKGALGPRPVTSPVFNESLQERLDRVLARVKEEKARRAASPAGSRPRSYISAASGTATPSGRLSPAGAQLNGRISPQPNSRSPSSLSTGRRSPFGERGRDSPSIDQILQQSPRSATSPRASSVAGSSRHAKQPSVASISSSLSTEQPSTPVTGGSNGGPNASFTPATSANSNHPVDPAQPRPRVMYRIDDFGYDRLEAIVQHAAMSVPKRERERDDALEGLFGRELDAEGELHPEVRKGYEQPRKAFADLDARLDALLLELIAV